MASRGTAPRGPRGSGNSFQVLSTEQSSPSSGSGKETPHDDGQSHTGSDGYDGALADHRNIGNSGSSSSEFYKVGLSRLSINGSEPREHNASPRSGRELFDNYDAPVRKNNRNPVLPYSGSGGPGGYRSSRTWVSSDTQHMQEFLVVRNAMRRLFKHSELAKWKYADYIAHREAMIASMKAKLANDLKMKEEAMELKVPRVIDPKASQTLEKYLPNPPNLNMDGNVGRVLGEKTIWCCNWEEGKEEVSPWPSTSEMKWEGDDRAKTGVGRFLPLPREMGAPGIPWNQLQIVEQYPIDQVARIPTMEDIYLPVDEVDEDIKHQFLNEDVEDAIDKLTES